MTSSLSGIHHWTSCLSQILHRCCSVFVMDPSLSWLTLYKSRTPGISHLLFLLLPLPPWPPWPHGDTARHHSHSGTRHCKCNKDLDLIGGRGNRFSSTYLKKEEAIWCLHICCLDSWTVKRNKGSNLAMWWKIYDMDFFMVICGS